MATKKYSIQWEDDKAVGFEVNDVVYKNLNSVPDLDDRAKLASMLNAAKAESASDSGSVRSPEKLILNIFTAVAALMLLIALVSSFANIRRITNEKTAPGIVVEMVVQRQYVNEQDRVFTDYSYPVVRFKADDGRQRDVQMSEGSSPPSYEVGDEVTVRYNPEHPLQARIASFGSNALMWILPTITGILGVAFFVAVWAVQKFLKTE